MTRKSKKPMILFVGSREKMLQVRTEGENHFSLSDGYWFSKERRGPVDFTFDQAVLDDPCVLKDIGDIGRSIVKNIIEGRLGRRRWNYRYWIDRILIVSAWQMNVFMKATGDEREVTPVVVKAFEKAFGRKVRLAQEHRPLGVVML
jgi:hypothetical protein